MPSEVSNIIIPFTESADILFDEIECVFSKKKDINKLLEYTNKILLKDKLGFNIKDIKLLSNRMLVFNLFSVFLFIIFIKAMNTDITYLKHFGNIPEYESIINYPIYNNHFHPM